MIKRMFGLFVALSFVLILAACVQPSKLGESFKQQPLSYDIHMKVLQVTGYLDDVDSWHVYEDGRSNLARSIFAYPDVLYKQLFTELGISERDFYCTPTLDVFARSTIFDMKTLFSSYNYYGPNATFQFLHVPTFSGDRYSMESIVFDTNNNKFISGSLISNPDLDQYLSEGIIPASAITTMGESYFDILKGPNHKRIELIDAVKYEFGYYYVPKQILWPQGVEKPAPGVYCNVAKALEFETKTSAFFGLVKGANSLSTLTTEDNHTVFAPTNTIIDNILNNKNGLFTKDEASRDKDIILKDHTVEGNYSIADLRDMAPVTLDALSGKKLYVVSNGRDVFINGFKITNPDMIATNGIIHNLEGVLYRPVRSSDKTIVDVINASEELDVLAEHIETLELAPTLVDGDFTVFAPGKKGYEAWLAAGQLSIERTSDHDLITTALLSHVTAGAYSRAQLLSMTKSSPLLLESLVEGVFIEISQDASENLYANGVLFTTDSLSATNGFVHIVETVILEEPLPDLFELIATQDDISRFDELLDILAFNGIFLNAESYTFFTPRNDSILDWMTETNIDIFSPNNIDQVVAFVYAHTAVGVYTRQELLTLSLNQPYNIESLLPNVSITITQDSEGKLYANGVLIVNSYEAINGAVHTLNGTIEPEVPNTLLDTLNLAGSFSIFIQLLEEVSLDVLLTQLTPQHTVVAPTNQAFENLMVELQIDLETLLALEGLENILKYHFIPGVVSMDNLNSLYNDELTSLDTLLNDRFILIGQDLESQITLNGYNLSPLHGAVDNGYLYFIETVLIPEPFEEEPVMGNLVEVLTEGGVFTTLVAALQETEIDLLLTGTENYTVFAPLDGYFMVKMIQEEITLETLLADPGLLEFLRSHIVLGSWDADSLKALVLSGQNTLNTLNGTALVITEVDGYLFVNGKDIIVPNTFATNGVVHSMAGFLVEF